MACIHHTGASTTLSRDTATLLGEAEVNASGVACDGGCHHRDEGIAIVNVGNGGACGGVHQSVASWAPGFRVR